MKKLDKATKDAVNYFADKQIEAKTLEENMKKTQLRVREVYEELNEYHEKLRDTVNQDNPVRAFRISPTQVVVIVWSDEYSPSINVAKIEDL